MVPVSPNALLGFEAAGQQSADESKHVVSMGALDELHSDDDGDDDPSQRHGA
jgi:hypothetical protein